MSSTPADVTLAGRAKGLVGEARRLASSEFVRSSTIYTVSSVANAAIPFLMMPILTRYLSPADYGVVAMFSVLRGAADPFVGLSVHGAVGVKYFDKETDLPSYVGNCMFVLAATGLAISGVFLAFGDLISRWTAFPRSWLLAVPLVSAAQFIGLCLMTLWQSGEEPVKFGTFQVVQTLVNVSLSILLVVGLGMNWQGRLIAQIVTMTGFAALALGLLRRRGWMTLKLDGRYIMDALRFGVPLIPHALGGIIITQTDRVFITNMSGLSSTGVYSVGFQIAMVVDIVCSSVNKAFVPWLYRRLSENAPGQKVRIVKLTYAYYFGIALFALSIAAVAPWFLSVFVGDKFAGAYVYTKWIALGYAFNGMYYMVANYAFYAEKTYALAPVTAITAVINIGLNYLLIKVNGPVGAAQASALALLVQFLLTWAMSTRIYPMPWNLSEGAARSKA